MVLVPTSLLNLYMARSTFSLFGPGLILVYLGYRLAVLSLRHRPTKKKTRTLI